MVDEEGGEGGSVSPVHQRKRKGSWTAEEKAAFWRAKKIEKRRRKKEAAAQRREAQQKEWEDLGEEERESRRAEAVKVHELRRAAEAKEHAQCEQNLADASLPVLVFDLSFAGCMTTTDCRSTVSQVKFSYSALRRHGFPMRPVITSIFGQEKTEPGEHSDVLRALSDFEGFNRYPPPIHKAHWSTLYKKEEVVYLTADADNALECLEPNTVYIVGAFVDHNARKFLTRDAARNHGVRMARLPIDESIEVGNRCKVLTINHVVEVLCRYAEGGDWGSAFEVLPTRRVNKTREKRSRVSGRENITPSHNDVESVESN